MARHFALAAGPMSSCQEQSLGTNPVPTSGPDAVTISAGGNGMTGALLVDLSGYPSGSDASGTVSLTRQ